MKYQKKLILNPVGIQSKVQRNINGNPFNPVKNKISMKYPWKSIGNQVEILMKRT